MAPACPILEPRFRITPNCSMNKQDLDDIIEVFVEARAACPPNPRFVEIKEIMNY
jgi:hypothetical protein